jgi:hypothetical protein
MLMQPSWTSQEKSPFSRSSERSRKHLDSTGQENSLVAEKKGRCRVRVARIVAAKISAKNRCIAS